MNLTIDNQGKVIRMKIVEFKTTRPHFGRRGSPAIPTGTTLYALEYETGGYFTYSYIKREDAETCIENGKLYQTNTEYYREWNLVMDKENTLHYGSL